MSRVVPLTAGQLPLFEMPVKRRSRKARYRHVHTKEELAAFDRTLAVVARIRGGLEDDERWCPGGCGKIIRRERRSCGRRWCDAVRPSWAASFRSVIHSALDAYCELYGSEAKLLQGVLTCTAEPWWWDRSKCSHGPDVPCSGPRGCRVLESVAEEQRLLWSARRRETLNMARTYAIRQLGREGWAEERWPSLLVWVLEDQSRGVPHLHFVLGHTTALEKAFARAFFRKLKSASYVHGLGHTSTYERAVLEQGKYEAGRLRNYVAKLARYLGKSEGAAEFLFRHTGERVFYVAPWLSGLSGVTMTVARLSRRVWGARFGLLRHAEDDRGAGAARRAAARLGGRGSKRTLSVRPSALQSCVLPLRGMRGDVITQGRVRSHCDMRRCAEAPSPRQSETVSMP